MFSRCVGIGEKSQSTGMVYHRLYASGSAWCGQKNRFEYLSAERI